MMSYVVLVLVCGAIGSNISNYVMKNVFDITNEEFGGQGFNFSIFKDFGISGGIILLVSIVLAFIAFGTISGLFGSTCNKTEDIQNATGNVMTVSMVCYFAAIASGAIDNNIVSLVGAIVPPLSFFTAPVAYVTGRISLPLLLLAFVLQIALIVFLVMLSAKSYRNLILSDSTTPKLKTIFKSAKM
jgi:ABC-type Na+ efflux pump permease subunit